ncbi:MAG: hypothetical protein ACREX6_01480 [Casimicrobiaceae bacterium]
MLVALVTMLIITLAAVALVRTTLATAAASGKVAIRTNLSVAGLAAVEAALVMLHGDAALSDPDVDAPANNYFSSRQAGEDARGVPAVLQSRAAYPVDARTLVAGDLSVRFVVERLCTAPGAAVAERCTLSPPSLAAIVGPADPGELAPAPYYRVSARIDAPDESVGFVQAMLGPGSAARRLAWRVLDE